MAMLVIAEHDNQTLSATTLNLVSAALTLGQPIDLLVAGFQCQNVAEQARSIEGVKQVLLVDNPSYQYQQAESMAALIVGMADGYQHIYAAASSSGKNILPRVAALLDVGQISDVVEVIDEQTFIRPIYAGNAMAKVRSLDSKCVVTIRTSAFDPVSMPVSMGSDTEESSAELQILPLEHGQTASLFVAETLVESERPDLNAARRIISGGRGMASGENFSLLEKVADKLGAAIGASRAAVDAGYVSNDLQVGQTGKIVAPDLYIAVGISGAIQHLAGMKDSKVIVAINSDEDAPIFQVADYGLVGDLFTLLPELEQLL